MCDVCPYTVCFIAMMPLQKIFDWGGDEIGAYLNDDLRDLLIITLSKRVSPSLMSTLHELTVERHH